MRTRAIQIVIAAVFTSVTYGQPTAAEKQDRVFQFAHTDGVQEIQEIATLIRAITEIPNLFADTTKKSLALSGTATQIGAAEWLFHELDKPANPQTTTPPSPSPVTHEYRMSGAGPENIIRVFYMAHADTVQKLQESATLVRAIVEFRRLFTYNAPKAVVVRGTADQVKFAEWLLRDLDQSIDRQVLAQRRSARHEYQMPGADPENAVRVFYLSNAETVQNLQEAATLVRALVEIRRVFTYNAPRAVVVRGTEEQVKLAAWLFENIDRPLNQKNESTQEYRMSGTDRGADRANIVRVFFLQNADTVQRLQQIATQVRSATAVLRLFTYNAPRAVAVRGSADQIAMADRLIKEWDQ